MAIWLIAAHICIDLSLIVTNEGVLVFCYLLTVFPAIARQFSDMIRKSLFVCYMGELRNAGGALRIIQREKVKDDGAIILHYVIPVFYFLYQSFTSSTQMFLQEV